ncbi:hypothetical protein RSOLAG1IB_10960 [Rhizoctonia solani AG-1 IB]|uniref:Uncharacterized protein n=1 Tax=Thanatephorus cucumeris (strain AG1-IB / isolate 7/3/14) TaxID=1108050 RepID=A0A0B7G652_THACB|nr:hypothetical protein RSOLAG1IB_10960 [Rhizoctonia solani AG-1 IB]
MYSTHVLLRARYPKFSCISFTSLNKYSSGLGPVTPPPSDLTAVNNSTESQGETESPDSVADGSFIDVVIDDGSGDTIDPFDLP